MIQSQKNLKWKVTKRYLTRLCVLVLLCTATTVFADNSSQQSRIAPQATTYDDLLIGVPFENSSDGDVRRAAGASGGFQSSIAQTISGDAGEATEFGKVIATGDFNGDGHTDVAFGIPNSDDLKIDSGSVLVRFGLADGSIGSKGMTLSPRISNYDETAFGRFGSTLAVGDFDGDGFDDLAVGHPYYDYTIRNIVYDQAGYVHVYFGQTANINDAQVVGLNSTPRHTFHKEDQSLGGNRNSERFGSALTTGDYNGDGYDDLIVGHPYDSYEGKKNFSGSIVGVYGNSGGLNFATKFTIDPDTTNNGLHGFGTDVTAANDLYGFAVTSGDFNGDGFDDIMAGIPGNDYEPDSKNDVGAVTFFYGALTGLDTDINIKYESNFGDSAVTPEVGDQFGYVLGAGDFNNDGYDDVVIGRPYEDWSTTVDAGALATALGSSSGIDFSTSQSIAQANGVTGSSETDDRFGWSLAVGDFNGDLYDDVAVGTPYEHINSAADTGDVRVFAGSAAGMVTPDFTTFYSGASGSGLNNAGGSLETDDRVGYSLAAMRRCGDKLDPSSSASDAPQLSTGVYKDLRICVGEQDVYKIVLGAFQKAEIDVSYLAANGIIDLNLYKDAPFTGAFVGNSWSGDGSETIQYTNNTGSSATYFLTINERGHDESNSYELRLNIPHVDCNDDSNEPNNTAVDATSVSAGTITGLVQCEDADYYKFSATIGSIIHLETTLDTAQKFNLELLNAQGNVLKQDVNLGSTRDNVTIAFIAPYSGDYYAKTSLETPISTRMETYQLKLAFPAPLTINFSAASYTVNENVSGGTLSVPVTLSGPALGIEKVRIKTVDGTATSGSDYTSSNTFTSFGVGDTTASLTIPILNDSNMEGATAETFKVTLSDQENLTLGTIKEATVSINDDDVPVVLPKVKFAAATYSKQEGSGNLTITVELDQAATGNEKVDYATSNGSALSGSDYTAKSGTVSFTAGQTTQTFSIVIANDTLDELNETFTVGLSNPQNATIDSPSSTTVTITDNDVPIVSVGAATYSVSEAAGNAVITVELDQAPASAVTVKYATSDNGATAGSDYTAKSGTLTFTAGQQSKTVNVAIGDDSADEPNEKFNFTLSAPTGATLGATKVAAVTITDNDAPGLPTVTLLSGSASVNEGDGTVTINVSLSKAAAADITLTYSTQDGSASAGSDYTGTGAGTSSVTFTAGSTTQSFTIPILDDTVVESAETFTVLLQDAPGANPGAIGEVEVTITDNDVTPPSTGFKVFLPILTK